MKFTGEFVVTNHAIHRYRERFSNCTSLEALDAITAAINESVYANKAIKNKIRHTSQLQPNSTYLYHRASCMLYVLVLDDGKQKVVTVWPLVE
jgi:hypothetical protein